MIRLLRKKEKIKLLISIASDTWQQLSKIVGHVFAKLLRIMDTMSRDAKRPSKFNSNDLNYVLSDFNSLILIIMNEF